MLKLQKKQKKIANLLWKSDKRLFFDVGSNDLNNNEAAIKYIGRYLSRAPIAEYRILKVTKKEVEFEF